MLAVRVLGPFELHDPGQGRIDVGSTLRCRVLGALVLRRGAVVSPEALAELVWPEDAQPANPAGAVQTHVARLRRILPPVVTLATEGRGYRVEVEPAHLDVDRFEALLRSAADDPDPGDRAEQLTTALGLWRGVPYVELEHPDVAAEAARLAELRLSAMERRAVALWDARRPDEATTALQALVAEAPLREAPVALLMRYLVASGRQSDALRAYTRLRVDLAEELGIDPSPELRALEGHILAQAPPAVGPPPSIPSSSPPAVRPVALPASSFLGRQDELATVAELLEAQRVVTLHGPGGVGKTRLARHAAAAVAARYPEGVTLVDLSAVGRAGGVREAAAVALRLELRGGQDLDEHLRQVLSVGRRLLVLDCCEHVIDEVAAWVEQLVAATAGTDLLATSREPLRIDGEHLVRLAPLTPDQAVRLFTDRLRAAGAPAPDVAERAAIAALCEALDRLPLALELAAARAPTVGLQGLLEGIDRRFELLGRGPRSAAAHHRSLRDVVEWSYALLTPEEQAVFRAFAFFAGPVELDTAVAVIADGRQLDEGVVRGILPDLAERSLAVRVDGDGAPAYRLLDTLRAFGRELLDDEVAVLRERLLDWVRRFAAEADVGQRGRDEQRWARRIDVQLADLVQAHRWLDEAGDVDGVLALTAVLGRHAVYRYRVDVAHLIDVTIARHGDVVSADTAHVLGCGGTIAWQRGRFGEAEELARRALEVAERCDDPLAARYGHDVLANLALFRGDADRSRAEAAIVIDRSVAAGDPVLQLSGMVDLILASIYAGDDDAADAAEAEAAVVTEDMGTPLWRGWFAYLLGERRARTQPDAAVPHLEAAVALAESTDARFLAGVARHTLVTTEARRLAPAEAVAAFRPLIDHWHRSGAWNQLWVAVRGLIEALARHGWHREAALLLGAHEASERSSPPFGADAETLAQVRADLAAALGPALEGALAEGAALGDDRAVALAYDVVRAVADPTTG